MFVTRWSTHSRHLSITRMHMLYYLTSYPNHFTACKWHESLKLSLPLRHYMPACLALACPSSPFLTQQALTSVPVLRKSTTTWTVDCALKMNFKKSQSENKTYRMNYFKIWIFEICLTTVKETIKFLFCFCWESSNGRHFVFLQSIYHIVVFIDIRQMAPAYCISPIYRLGGDLKSADCPWLLCY